MDKIASLSTAIIENYEATQAAYTPLLLGNRDKIWATPKKTFSYGSNHRQTLDVYEPSQGSDGSNPILVFFHGGGFVQGGKTVEGLAGDTVYANLGYFFSEIHGFTTVIADYRLFRHAARYPSGGEDYALVVRWAIENLARGKRRDLNLMGHSAGGAHMWAFLMHPDFAETREAVLDTGDPKSEGLVLKNVISSNSVCDFEESPPYRREVLVSYYGDIHANCPAALLRDRLAEKQEICPGAKVFVVVAEFDPEDECVRPARRFKDKLEQARECSWITAKGHNHLSLFFGLGTRVEREEKWANELVESFKVSA